MNMNPLGIISINMKMKFLKTPFLPKDRYMTQLTHDDKYIFV